MKQKQKQKSNEVSDNEYWKQYSLNKSDNGFESKQNHDIEVDIVCKFKGLNGGVIYETKETSINCNLEDLQIWFRNLKKIIRMLDETIADKEVGDGL